MSNTHTYRHKPKKLFGTDPGRSKTLIFIKICKSNVLMIEIFSLYSSYKCTKVVKTWLLNSIMLNITYSAQIAMTTLVTNTYRTDSALFARCIPHTGGRNKGAAEIYTLFLFYRLLSIALLKTQVIFLKFWNFIISSHSFCFWTVQLPLYSPGRISISPC